MKMYEGQEFFKGGITRVEYYYLITSEIFSALSFKESESFSSKKVLVVGSSSAAIEIMNELVP